MVSNNHAAAILAAFERDADINLHRYPITVKVDDGIYLEGEVEHIIAKRKALRIAKQTANTVAIVDRLRLRVGSPRANKELMNAVLNALIQEPAFAQMEIRAGIAQPTVTGRNWIGLFVQGSRVELRGEVNSLAHRWLAEVISWWVPGSADVINRIHVYPMEAGTDDEITDMVRLIFDKETSLNSDQIAINTRNSEVTLLGVVHSEEQKRIASYDCWYIPGVHAVHNKLTIMLR
jgi:osmotically-inducible protein OsmY